jgi:hypothetical protein
VPAGVFYWLSVALRLWDSALYVVETKDEIARKPILDVTVLRFAQAEIAVLRSTGQLVRVNLQAEGVMFQAAVTDAVGHIVKQTSEQPPKYLVKLLFSFRGVNEVEVPADRIHADK